MKNYLLIVLSILTSMVSFAQDTIVKKNGDEIECVVLEVNSSFVKCKKFNSSEETIFRFVTDDIFMIKYMNGETTLFADAGGDVPLNVKNDFFGKVVYVGDKKLRPKQVRGLLINHSDALDSYNTGRSLLTIGNIIAIPSAFVFGYQLGYSLFGGEVNNSIFIASGVGTAIGMVVTMLGDGSTKKSVKIYNAEISNNSSVQLNMGFTKNGIGLCLAF